METIRAIGCEYVSEKGNTEATVNGRQNVPMRIREEFFSSCITESLYNLLTTQTELSLENNTLTECSYKGRKGVILGMTRINIGLKQLSFRWTVYVIRLPIALGINLEPMLILGNDFWQTRRVQLHRVHGYGVLHEISYEIPYSLLKLCGCIGGLCNCRLVRFEYSRPHHRERQDEENWD